jgi:hypothetical protein
MSRQSALFNELIAALQRETYGKTREISHFLLVSDSDRLRFIVMGCRPPDYGINSSKGKAWNGK